MGSGQVIESYKQPEKNCKKSHKQTHIYKSNGKQRFLFGTISIPTIRKENPRTPNATHKSLAKKTNKKKKKKKE